MSNISIVIPSYNRAGVIGHTLQSLIDQTYQDWECIIVDDGSTDGTLEVIQTFVKQDNRFSFYKRDRLPKGAPTCRNIGWRRAKADKIIFLDSDDLFLPWAIEERMALTYRNNNLDLCVFQSLDLFSESPPRFRGNPKLKDYLAAFLTFQTTFQTTSLVWKKELLVKLNGWWEGNMRWDDPEIHSRALASGASLKWVSEIPDTLIRNGNIDQFKITDLGKIYSLYTQKIDTYIFVYNQLEESYKKLFSKSIKSEIWSFIAYLSRQQINEIANKLSEANVLDANETNHYKSTGALYSWVKNIPILRSIVFRFLIKTNITAPEKYTPYEDNIAWKAFQTKLNLYYNGNLPESMSVFNLLK
jgi:glycosyltransferase involved in cell wall biosynthesis